jgi:trehalose 6-phosphate phosphatase
MSNTMLDFGTEDENAPGAICPDRLGERLSAAAAEWALCIDIDGTLLDMAPSPDAVEVPPDLVETLARVKRHFGGSVALITGRRIADADQFFAPLQLIALGVHGAEARPVPRGPVSRLGEPLPPPLTRAVHAVADALPGVLVEDKGVGLAVHYRHAP